MKMLVLSSLTVFVAQLVDLSAAEQTDRTISGFVMELRSGTPDVQVFLCDAKTGMPLTKDFVSFFDEAALKKEGMENRQRNLAVVKTDEKGRFRFEEVPNGTYRVVSMKWAGPYHGLFEKQGTVVQLLGVVNEIKVPRPPDVDTRIVPMPPGKRILDFQQETGNNETLLLLSTQPPEFDPILGFDSLGDDFMSQIVGVHRMLLGKTTVLNAPNETLYGFFFAADNLPGFAHVTIPESRSPYVAIPAVPFVATWSNGRKTPEGKVAELLEVLRKHDLDVATILSIPPLSSATIEAYRTRMRELKSILAEKIEVTEGVEYRVGDLLAAEAYLRFARQ